MDLHKVLQCYALGKVFSITKYTQGQHNQTYKVRTTKGNYSLRIYNYRKPAQIGFELALLGLLNNLPVPHPVKQKNGTYLSLVETKHALLYHYLHGKHLAHFTNKQLFQVGAFIAMFHGQGKNLKWNKKRFEFYTISPSKIKSFTATALRAKIPYLSELPAIVKELNKNQLDPSLPQGPIHVDIKPDNVLFYRGRLSGVLDFDNSYIGPLILDLGKSMAWFASRTQKFDVSKAIEIYRGYISKRQLSSLEYKELYKALKFAFVSHVFMDYYMRALQVTSAAYFEFMITDFYQAYRSFTLSETEFYDLLST